MELTLYRYNFVTQGILKVEQTYFGDTLELPWRDNRHDISCIPEGRYQVKYKYSLHNGDCLEVLNVPHRSDIQIHVGNKQRNTTGCILIGIKVLNTLQESGLTLKRLINTVLDKNGPNFLEIKRL